MNNREWLEEMERFVNNAYFVGHVGDGTTFSFDKRLHQLIAYAKEQVKKVKMLEESYDRLEEIHGKLNKDYVEIKERVRELKCQNELEYNNHKNLEAGLLRENERYQKGLLTLYENICRDGKYGGYIPKQTVYDILNDIEALNES